MSNTDCGTQEAIAHDHSARITGPHPGVDKYGRIDHYYYRCARCGVESVDKADLRRCC